MLASSQPARSAVLSETKFLEEYQKKDTARKPEESRLAAWQSFCQTLFCRNEFLYLD